MSDSETNYGLLHNQAWDQKNGSKPKCLDTFLKAAVAAEKEHNINALSVNLVNYFESCKEFGQEPISVLNGLYNKYDINKPVTKNIDELQIELYNEHKRNGAWTGNYLEENLDT